VTVLIPNAKIAARWNGALEARLRHAPLERFLRSKGRKWATGETRNTDNLAGAAIYFVNQALGHGEAQGPLSASQQYAVGQVACIASSSLALLIQEPDQWRTAALVSTARLLERQVGLSAAAHVAAAATREYNSAVACRCLEVGILNVGHAVRTAVETNSEADSAEAARLILARIAGAASPDSVRLDLAIGCRDLGEATIGS
jgi:hypothetical protein